MRKGNCGIELVFKFSIDMRSGPSYNEFQEKRRWFCGFWWGVPVLIGTQMVAKGLNLPNVTLVGVLDADLSLYTGGYRAGETTFNMLTQVVGRAGRGDAPGHHPDPGAGAFGDPAGRPAGLRGILQSGD